MLPNIHVIPLDPTTLGIDATPDFNTLNALFLALFYLIFKVSKAQVSRSNCAGQANT